MDARWPSPCNSRRWLNSIVVRSDIGATADRLYAIIYGVDIECYCMQLACIDSGPLSSQSISVCALISLAPGAAISILYLDS